MRVKPGTEVVSIVHQSFTSVRVRVNEQVQVDSCLCTVGYSALHCPEQHHATPGDRPALTSH